MYKQNVIPYVHEHDGISVFICVQIMIIMITRLTFIVKYKRIIFKNYVDTYIKILKTVLFANIRKKHVFSKCAIVTVKQKRQI